MDSNNQHLRCQSKNPQGIQCGFPKGHTGLHGNGLQHRAWEDKKPAVIVVGKQQVRIHEGNIPSVEFNGFNTHVDRSGKLDQIHTSGYVQEIKRK